MRLFDAVAPVTKTWDILRPTFRPLAGGTFIVDGIPITYGLEGSAFASSFAGLAFGPGDLAEMQVFVTGSEAARLRRLHRPPRFDPVVGPLPVLVDRPWDPEPSGTFSGDAMLRFDALASAGTMARAKLEASLGIFGNLFSATAFAGLEGSATANARTNVDTYVSLRWSDGIVSMSTTLDLHTAFDLALRISAFAGVRVELRIPDIPVVTDLMDEVEDWPILGWVVPDRSRWRWSKEYRKDWPLLNKNYRWRMSQRFVVNNGSATGALPDAQGFAIDQALRDVEAQQRGGDLTNDPTGPGQERRNSDTSAVSAAKSAALAQISSAKRAAEREKKANARLLTQARRAARPNAASAGGQPPAATIGGGGGRTPFEQLEARGEKLEQAVRATGQLRQRADALNEPATAPDGTSRNEARAGYESVAANADALGDKINRAEEGFAVPPAAEPSDPDYDRMRTAMRRAYDVFDEGFDPARTEKLYADDQLRAAGDDTELHVYRAAVEGYQRRAGALWNRVQRLEDDLERASEWYERNDRALGATVFAELEVRARSIAMDATALKRDRPVGDWDLDFVELSGGHLMLKPQYRRKATRSYFYPHDYSAATKNRMMLEIGSFRTVDNLVYWEYRGKRSPRGDHWWLLDHPQEMPTLDHTRPTVLGHWNAYGRRSAYPERRRFFDFEGAGLIVVPKKDNSSAGGREPDSYVPRVTRTFRGAKV